MVASFAKNIFFIIFCFSFLVQVLQAQSVHSMHDVFVQLQSDKNHSNQNYSLLNFEYERLLDGKIVDDKSHIYGSELIFSPLYLFSAAILLVLYGSFRSLNTDDSLAEEDKTSENSTQQTIDLKQALWLPVATSLFLLAMFLFFDLTQCFFAALVTVWACIGLSDLAFPMCQAITRQFALPEKVSIACFGRHPPALCLSYVFGLLFVSLWLFTGHWLFMNVLSIALCVSALTFFRLPSLKVSCLLLIGLLVYDVFWVFFSVRWFDSNVMIKVATAEASNPVSLLARKLHWKAAENAPRLALPGKFIIPEAVTNAGKTNFSMLGLGDVVIPGLLLSFVLRFEKHKNKVFDEALSRPKLIHRLRYFYCTLVGYFLGLATAVTFSSFCGNAQPVLLYVVPFTLLPLVTLAYLKGDLLQMWNNPFQAITQSIDV